MNRAWGAQIPRRTDNWKSVSHISIRRIVESLNALAPSSLLCYSCVFNFCMKMFNAYILLFWRYVKQKNYIIIYFIRKDSQQKNRRERLYKTKLYYENLRNIQFLFASYAFARCTDYCWTINAKYRETQCRYID